MEYTHSDIHLLSDEKLIEFWFSLTGKEIIPDTEIFLWLSEKFQYVSVFRDKGYKMKEWTGICAEDDPVFYKVKYTSRSDSLSRAVLELAVHTKLDECGDE